MSAETIFVSYSSKDRPFALGLVKELQNLGANVWIDQLGIGLGENWDNAIEEALEKSETFMLILSQTSVESPNVQDEVSIAINTNKNLPKTAQNEIRYAKIPAQAATIPPSKPPPLQLAKLKQVWGATVLAQTRFPSSATAESRVDGDQFPPPNLPPYNSRKARTMGCNGMR